VQAEAPKREFLPPLMGIRGLTIMWMVIGHLQIMLVALLPCLRGFVSVTVGVKFRMDLLFMLSGFLISYVYIADRGRLTLGAYERFLRSRLIRLYPVYAVITLILLCLNGFISAASSLEFRIGLLLIFAALLATCALLPKRALAVRQVCCRLLSSCRIGFALLVLPAGLLLLGLVIIVATHFRGFLGGNHTWTIIPVRLAMLQAWPWVPLDTRPYGSVWFLSALWFAYLFVFPIAWLLVLRLRSTWAMLLWVFMPVAVRLTVLQVPSLAELEMVTRSCCGFLCGSALFALYANRSKFITAAQKLLDATVLLFLALSILIPALESETARRNINCLLMLGVPFLLAGGTAGLSFTSKFVSSRIMLWLGKISYSLFMSHQIAMVLAGSVLPFDRYAHASLSIRILIVLAYLACILAVAVAIYRFIEAPWAAALKGFSLQRHPRLATAPPLAVLAAQDPPR
jgi:peptidoglycan/LPS O-acetylase OafA/YrhL